MNSPSKNVQSLDPRANGPVDASIGYIAKHTANPSDNDNDPPPSPAAPAARAQVPQEADPGDLTAIVDRFARFNAGQLRDWNERVQSDPSVLQDLEAAIVGVVDWQDLLRTVRRSAVDRHTARNLIKHIGFPAASLNRHYLVAGAKAGEKDAGAKLETFFGKATGMSLDALMATLAGQGDHPPYHSYYTYWLANPEQLMFTMDPGEAYFHSIVSATNVSFARACELLKPLQLGDVPLDHVNAVAAINAAQAAISAMHDAYNFQIRDPGAGVRRMEPEFFMHTMRGYIAPALIGSQTVEGPNATYSPGWPRLDFALGNREEFYLRTVRGRYRWMVPEHRALLDQSLELPALAQQILVQIGFERAELEAPSVEGAAERMRTVGRGLRASIRAYASLVETFIGISGTHLAMIKNYLVKPAAKLSDGELARIVPNPNAGVGGNHIQHTQAIFEMRKSHALNRSLIGIARKLV